MNNEQKTWLLFLPLFFALFFGGLALTGWVGIHLAEPLGGIIAVGGFIGVVVGMLKFAESYDKQKQNRK